MPSTDLATPTGRVRCATTAMDAAGGPLPNEDLARLAACSTRQLQRDFAEVLDVSPRKCGATLRSGAGRRALQSSPTVLDAVSSAGYGSVRAFYEETARRLGMTPAAYARKAPQQLLLWSMCETSVGEVIAVASPEGLAAVRIGSGPELVAGVSAAFAGAELVRNDAAMRDVMQALRRLAVGLETPDLPVAVVAMAFQARVWSALRAVPVGTTTTYTEVARSIGSPDSARGVARACATNPVALAIPCHRVIRADGNPAGYRWGRQVKQALLAAEAGAPAAADPS